MFVNLANIKLSRSVLPTIFVTTYWLTLWPYTGCFTQFIYKTSKILLKISIHCQST